MDSVDGTDDGELPQAEARHPAVRKAATTELHQPSPFACVGDFDGDGLDDVALVARDQTTQRLKLLALHQVNVNWNVGGLTRKSYLAYTLVEGGPVPQGTQLGDRLVVCEKPGRFESVDGGRDARPPPPQHLLWFLPLLLP